MAAARALGDSAWCGRFGPGPQATLRKVATLGLSFVMYPKPFGPQHLVGVIFVIGAVALELSKKLGGASASKSTPQPECSLKADTWQPHKPV